MSFVTVRDVFQTYGQRPIIERVNVEVEEGEFISIVGASGGVANPRSCGCYWRKKLRRADM